MEKNEQLVKRLHRDDEEALNWLYDAYHQAVLANIRRLVHSQEESEDILQNVFLALWEGRHRLTVRQSLSGWLFTASYYKSLEYLRSAVRLSLSALSDDQLENVADEADAEDGFEEKMALVSEAMRVLPPRK
ncbi:MAG: hypothetical protein JST42_13110, partial [Bacteroidetes bacterium]|nr:hypothetical protein [Bacteroidota bacterium]